jgi:hypothetical protein
VVEKIRRSGLPESPNGLEGWQARGAVGIESQEIIEKANTARQEEQLGDFINELTRQVERAYQAEVGET